ncbi:MAG: PASTA domain-containing protein [Candidatus Cloacimonetes bacterium]|nr:PASTA domain-containing protein [Candidatus Cloacimonadota bacterium]
MIKLKSILLAIAILIGLFSIAFFGTDIIMKIIVGHGNEVQVPLIIGTDFEVARKICTDNKLYIEQSEFVNDENIEKGKIISQKPNPGIMTKKYRTISVVVSLGPEMVRIPYLDNLSIVGAKLKLENAGLFIGEKIFRYSEEVEKGFVIYSQPMADELIARKSEVKIIVSLGRYTSASGDDNKWKNLLDN